MKILVVGDEICQQEWLTRNLSNTEHEVTTACDGDRSRPTVHHADGLYPISVNFAEAASIGRSVMKKRTPSTPPSRNGAWRKRWLPSPTTAGSSRGAASGSLRWPHCECGYAETESSAVIGWCLHCDHVYVSYGPEIADIHFADNCPAAPVELKKSARERLSKH